MNRLILKYLSALLAVVVVTLSCERQPIYTPEYVSANIPITIDWSGSTVDEASINNVSVYFYPVDGSDPVITYSGDSDFITVTVRKGTYNIVIHNEMAGNITGIDCYNEKSYEDYQMSIQFDNQSNYDMFYTESSDAEQLIKESEQVGVWRYENYEVTTDMIEYTRSESFSDLLTKMRSKSTDITDYETLYESTGVTDTQTKGDEATTKTVTKSLEELLGITPSALTTTYEVIVEVENMNNIQYIEAVIPGFVESAYVANGQQNSSSALHYAYFTMSDHQYNEGSTTDGVLSYSFTNLGHRSDDTEQYDITFNIVLHDGTLVTETIDITDQLADKSLGQEISISIGDEFDNGTSTIILPVNSDAGFGVGVWGDAENVFL